MTKKKIKPITTGGAGYIPSAVSPYNAMKIAILGYINPDRLPLDTVRLRIYNNLYLGYNPGLFGAEHAIRAVRSAVSENKSLWGDAFANIFLDDEERQSYMDDLFAEYLNIPKNKRRKGINRYGRNLVVDARYSPSIGKSGNYKMLLKGHSFGGLSDGLGEEDREKLIGAALKGENEDLNLPFWSIPIQHKPITFGESVNSNILLNYGLGTHTISRGIDPKKGDYVSYYDLWDMAPLSYGGAKDLSFGIGKPFELYDRVYLDDHYGVDSSARPGTYYGGYLPEVIIKPKRNDKK